MTTNMTHKVEIYVPSVHDSEVLPIVRKFNDAYGGSTVVHADGYYTMATGEVVCDQVTIVYSFTNSVNERMVEHMAMDLARDMAQECVAVAIDNKMYLVYPE